MIMIMWCDMIWYIIHCNSGTRDSSRGLEEEQVSCLPSSSSSFFQGRYFPKAGDNIDPCDLRRQPNPSVPPLSNQSLLPRVRRGNPRLGGRDWAARRASRAEERRSSVSSQSFLFVSIVDMRLLMSVCLSAYLPISVQRCIISSYLFLFNLIMQFCKINGTFVDFYRFTFSSCLYMRFRKKSHLGRSSVEIEDVTDSWESSRISCCLFVCLFSLLLLLLFAGPLWSFTVGESLA